MKSLTADNFFRLSSDDPAELWNDRDLVWMALHHLDGFFQKVSCSLKPAKIPPNVVVEHPDQVWIGDGVILEPGVMIRGPCVLGDGCIVRHGAYLRGGVLCKKNCVIGHASEVKHSILLEGVQVAHLAYVGDSILGNHVNLGAGVKCANLRLDRREVTVSFAEKKIATGLKKFGCVLGDGCQIGCNTVLNPGTLLGIGCFCYPLVNLHGVIPARTRIKNKNSEQDLDPIETAVLEWLR